MKTHRNKLMNLKGRTFGRLEVIDTHQSRDIRGQIRTWAAVVCACGTAFDTNAASIFYGRTKSCGCLCRETARASMLALKARGKGTKQP